MILRVSSNWNESMIRFNEQLYCKTPETYGQLTSPNTIAQHHWIAKVGQELWRSPSPKLCSEWGQVQQVAQSQVLLGFQYLQRWRIHSLSAQPVLVFKYPQLLLYAQKVTLEVCDPACFYQYYQWHLGYKLFRAQTTSYNITAQHKGMVMAGVLQEMQVTVFA